MDPIFNEIIIVEKKELSKYGEPRYIILNKKNGKLIDDANGYGYTSESKAFSAYKYRIKKNKKLTPKQLKDKDIENWMNQHKDFIQVMKIYKKDMSKKPYGKNVFDSAFVSKLLKAYGLKINFSASDLVRIFNKKWKD